MAKKIIVDGTGTCGLTAAYRLRRQGFDTVLLERAERFGGRTKTDYADGWVDDLGGSLLATTYVDALKLAEEVGLKPKFEDFGGAMQIYVKGVFYDLDMGNPLLTLMKMPFLSWRSKLSLVRLLPVLLKYWRKINLYNLSATADLDTESAESFCLKRVTPEAYDLLLNPLTRSMFGHDCNEISIVELLWMLKTYGTAGAVGFQGGMNTFTEALARGQTILTGHEVQRIEEMPNGVVVTAKTAQGEVKLEADCCAIAADGKDMQRIYGHALTARQNHFLDKLDYNPLSMVFFKFDIKPEGVGAIVEIPRSEDPDLAALAWYDLWGQTKAPRGETALIVLGMNSWQYRMYDKPVEERIADARRYVEKYYPHLIGHIVSADVTPWPRGTTVGRVGNYRRLKDFVADIEPASRIQYGGDYFAQSSIGTAVATGEDLAARMRMAVGAPI